MSLSDAFNHEVRSQRAQSVESSRDSAKSDERELKIHMPGAPDDTYTIVGPDQIKRVYDDAIGARLMIIVDEVCELLMPTGVKSESGKQEDALKQEISMIIQSITQLGRSAGIHCCLATQRNDTTILSGIIQNNSLSLDTKVLVRRPR